MSGTTIDDRIAALPASVGGRITAIRNRGGTRTALRLLERAEADVVRQASRVARRAAFVASSQSGDTGWVGTGASGQHRVFYGSVCWAWRIQPGEFYSKVSRDLVLSGSGDARFDFGGQARGAAELEARRRAEQAVLSFAGIPL